MPTISPERREQIVDALRRGTVPQSSLDAFAVGLDRFEPALDDELRKVASGGSVFKAVRGEYGCGKTFFARWLADRARRMGFASSEVQVSEAETPLHRLETVYRRLNERLATKDTPQGALRNIVDSWIFTLEEDVLAGGSVDPNDAGELLKSSNELLERRLADRRQGRPDLQRGVTRLSAGSNRRPARDRRGTARLALGSAQRGGGSQAIRRV